MKKKQNNKEAKFFCESCGAQVKQNAKFCTNCGKFFSSVRCPKCGCTGRTEQFIKGCPECGYAVTPTSVQNRLLQNTNSNTNKKSTNKLNKFHLFSRRNYNSDSLPGWIYFISIASLIVIIFCMYSCLHK